MKDLLTRLVPEPDEPENPENESEEEDPEQEHRDFWIWENLIRR